MSNVDISVAVATKSGLITPIVKNAPFLNVEQISDSVKVRFCLHIELLHIIIVPTQSDQCLECHY